MAKEFKLENGVVIPAIGYGSYKSTDKDGKQTIIDALDSGYRYIDTAMIYRNEKEIGDAISEYGISRDELFICSKVWPTDLSKEGVKKSFEESCKALRTDYLDMYLIHWPKVSNSDEKWVEKIIDAWTVMEELYDEGRIKAIGLSNFLPHHIRPFIDKVRIKPMVDQLELHVGYMQEYTLEYLKTVNILPQAWSPLGRARLISDERIMGFAEKYGKSPAQVLLRYLNQRDIPVIPKTSDKTRMKDNQNIFDFELTEDEISYLSCITETGWSGEHPDMVEWIN